MVSQSNDAAERPPTRPGGSGLTPLPGLDPLPGLTPRYVCQAKRLTSQSVAWYS